MSELSQDARSRPNLNRNNHPDAGQTKDRKMVQEDEGCGKEGSTQTKAKGSRTQGCRDKKEEVPTKPLRQFLNQRGRQYQNVSKLMLQ